jgi:hypothetical protein
VGFVGFQFIVLVYRIGLMMGFPRNDPLKFTESRSVAHKNLSSSVVQSCAYP